MRGNILFIMIGRYINLSSFVLSRKNPANRYYCKKSILKMNAILIIDIFLCCINEMERTTAFSDCVWLNAVSPKCDCVHSVYVTKKTTYFGIRQESRGI